MRGPVGAQGESTRDLHHRHLELVDQAKPRGTTRGPHKSRRHHRLLAATAASVATATERSSRSAAFFYTSRQASSLTKISCCAGLRQNDQQPLGHKRSTTWKYLWTWNAVPTTRQKWMCAFPGIWNRPKNATYNMKGIYHLRCIVYHDARRLLGFVFQSDGGASAIRIEKMADSATSPVFTLNQQDSHKKVKVRQVHVS